MPFPVTCPACGKSFSISDEIYDQKIKGRVVSVKCKQCQGAIRVDGTKAGTSVRAEAPVASVGVPAAAAEPPPPAAAPVEPPAPVVAPEPPPPQPSAVAREVPPVAPKTTEEAPAAPKAAEAPAPRANSFGGRDAVPKEPFGRPAAGLGLGARNRSGALGAASAAELRGGTFGARSPAAGPGPSPAVAASSPAAVPASPVAASPALATPAAPPTAAAPVAAPAPTPSPTRAVAPLPQETVLFAVDSAEGDRELTAEQIGKEIAAGTITDDTLVWRDGMAEWLEVKKVPELASFLKKPDPPKQSPFKATAPTAGTAPAGRFRPRQPTLPMGALPDGVAAKSAGAIDAKAEQKPPRAPTPTSIENKRDARANSPLGSRVPFLTPVPADDEPTVLRAPEAVAALLSAAMEEKEKDDHTPVPPRLAANRTNPTETGTMPLPPVAPRTGVGSRTELGLGARNPLDRITPPPGVPGGMPGSLPSSERRTASGPKVSPIDTFRESPEAKRAWFPEPVPGQPPAEQGSPPPPPSQAAPSSDASPPPPPPPMAFQGAPPLRFQAPPPFTPPLGLPANQPIANALPQPLAPSGFVPGPTLHAPPTHAGVALGDDIAFRPKRGKALWIVLALLAVVAAAVLFVVFGLKKPPPPPPAPPVPAAEAPAPAAPAAATTETAEDMTAPTAPAASSTADVTPPPTPAGNRDPLAEPVASAPPSGGFADLFAAGAKKASGGRFDPKLGKAAVDVMLMEASHCRERGGPTGITRVTVTFEPTGVVSSAVVADAPIAGTATAACISSVFKRATVQPFTGMPGTVTERISIQ